MFILSLIVGIIAIFCWVLSVQQKSKKEILLFQTIANVFYCFQYLFLGANAAALMNLTSSFRCAIFYKDEKQKKTTPKSVMIFFIIVIILIGVFTVKSWLMLIPIVITIFYTYSSWQNDMQKLRIIYIIAAIIWLYYNFTVMAYASIFGNILEILSGLTSLLHFKNEKKQKIE